MMRKNMRKRSRKVVGRHKKTAFLFKMLLIVFVIAIFFGATTIFFKINEIKIVGDSRYTDSQIITSSGVQVGDNLMFIEKISIAKNMFKELLYLDKVKINRIFPDVLEITVKDSVPTFTFLENGNNILLDTNGKYLENIEDPAAYIQIIGLEPLLLHIGDNIFETHVGSSDLLGQIVDSLKKYNLLKNVKSIDITKDYDIKLKYTDRFDVLLGDSTELDKKIMFLSTVESKLSENDKGVIDISDSTVARFIPNK